METSNNNFNAKDIVKVALTVAEYVVTFIKSAGIVIGVIASSLADVGLGALTLALAFNIPGGNNIPPLVKYLPFLISAAASGIQLILWQVVEDQKGLSGLFKDAHLSTWLAVISVLILFVADTYTDITSINVMMHNSQIAAFLSISDFGWLRNSILAVAITMAGFSEVFLVQAFKILKKQAEKEPRQSYRPQSSQNRRNHPQGHRDSDRSDQRFRTPSEMLDFSRRERDRYDER